MQASALPSFQADLLIQALCRTLLHSLWQGVILAALAGIIMLATRRQKAASRYYLLVGALALFTGGAAVTFVWEWLALQPAQGATASGLAAVEQLRIANTVVAAPSANALTQQLFQYLSAHAQQVVLIWFLFICIKSIRMLTGLYEVRMLRTQQTIAPDARWSARVQDLARQLRISRPVRLLESALAKAPMVLGHLKPLILVPAGLLSSLTPEAIEAILLHELAHIRRRDYLVNLLQSFVEILFFFNPAVTWICALLKAERENCCDDLVMQYTHSKTVYIQALVSCQEYGHPELAMALPGSRNTLLARVTRMISNHNHSLNVVEKTLLSVCLVGAGLLLLAFPGKAARHVVKTITTTTTFDHQTTITDTRNVTLSIDRHNDTCTLPQLATLDDMRMAPLPAFTSLDGTLRPQQASLGALSSACPTLYWVDSNQRQTLILRDDTAAKRWLEDRAYEAAEKQRLHDEQAAVAAEDQRAYEAAEKQRASDERQRTANARAYQVNAHQYFAAAQVPHGSGHDTTHPRTSPSAIGAPRVQYMPNVAARVQPTAVAMPAPVAKPAAKAIPVTHVAAAAPPPVPVKPIAPLSPLTPAAPPTPVEPVTPPSPDAAAEKDENLSDRVVQELLQSHLIVKTKNLSFKLSREAFIVNDKPMRADIAKAFADKFVPKDHWALLYNYEVKN
ncbi:hypothetical protein DCC81_21145 [Chitinophaga parva]|uniref:Peptidase M56 domain-containing protein n=1 Tax=Chitinophaga parva TaxID=2169414 RepID=A0A2T7BCV3_9BACT|nr:M56 family metallopeptidase [Chitinophaga parva]PUZ22924.1 hypothetical protein DCC81_21145 [Chitinophaga parva]